MNKYLQLVIKDISVILAQQIKSGNKLIYKTVINGKRA